MLDKHLIKHPDLLLQSMVEGVVGQHNLTKPEIALVSSMLAELQEAGNSSTLDYLYEADFWRKPPTIVEFLEDDYFLGQVCKRDDEMNQKGLYGTWRETLCEAFHPSSKMTQLILTGSIGGGKSFCGAIAMLYKMCRVLCMRNPLLYLGMSKISNVTFTMLSSTKDQIQEGAWAYAMNGMLGSPFFNEQVVAVDDGKKHASLKMELARGVRLEAGSKARHALGRNVIAALVDEINFRIEKDAVVEAERLIKGLERRYKSRFRNSTEGLIVVISSANNETDFLVNHIKKNRNNPTFKICDFPYWKTAGPSKFEEQGGYLFEKEPDNQAAWFAVDTGSSTEPARVLDDPEEISIVQRTWPHRLLRVPVEHRDEFEDGLELAIKEIAGKSTGRMAKFFSNIMPVINSLSDYRNPAKGVECALSVGGDQSGLVDFFDLRLMVKQTNGVRIPIRDPVAPRFIHLDFSTGAQDAMGFGMVHPTKLRRVSRLDKASQMKQELVVPIFEVDFAIRLVRSKTREPLDFGKVREFIVFLRDVGFKIAGISCDLAALSHETRSILKQMGFAATYLSVDKKKDPYETLRQVIHEDRLRMFEHDYLILELINLEDTGKKIDHPPKFDVDWCGILTDRGCFTGDTKVSLLDGREVSFRALVDEYHGQSFWVYSLDNDLKIVPGLASNPRVTKRLASIVEVELDNGEKVRCTPDHRFCVNSWPGFRYVEAAQLKPGDSLSALTRKRCRLDKRETMEYEMLWNLSTGNWEYTHRVMFGQSKRKGYVIHHADFNRFNNRPDNLCEMEVREHFKLHSDYSSQLWQRPQYRGKMMNVFVTGVQGKLNLGYKAYITNNLDRHVEHGTSWWQTSAGKEKIAALISAQTRVDISFESVVEAVAAVGSKAAPARLGCGRETMYRILREHGFSGTAELRQKCGIKRRPNHKVVAVRHLEELEDVYDISVEKYDNFALSTGVFVHNSKDLTDTIAGAIYNAEASAASFVLPWEDNALDRLTSLDEASVVSGAIQRREIMKVERGAVMDVSDMDDHVEHPSGWES